MIKYSDLEHRFTIKDKKSERKIRVRVTFEEFNLSDRINGYTNDEVKKIMKYEEDFVKKIESIFEEKNNA